MVLPTYQKEPRFTFLTVQRHDMVRVHTSDNSNFRFTTQPSSHAGIIVQHERFVAIPRRLLSVQFYCMDNGVKAQASPNILRLCRSLLAPGLTPSQNI